MKSLIRATIPVVAGNAFVKSADWQGKMDQLFGYGSGTTCAPGRNDSITPFREVG